MFYDMYPEMRQVNFHMSGQSYAGKYLPIFAYYVLEHNKNESNQPIPLTTTYIVDPYPSPVPQRTQMNIIAEGLGTIDDHNLEQVSALIQHCRSEKAHNMSKGVDNCNKIMRYIKDVNGKNFEYNARIYDYDWEPEEEVVVDFLTKSGKVNEIYEAIHINMSTKSPVFEWSSDAVDIGYLADGLIDYSWYYSYLIESQHNFIVMAGEFD
jgi:carboxypeptidase C (cathepsin A)